MKSELLYAQHIRHRRRMIILCIVSAVVVIFGMYKVTDRIRTHTMPVGQIQLQIPYSKYLVGEEVTFTIKNNYNTAITFTNKCPGEPLNVYRLENNKWVRIHDTAPKKDCSKEDRQIQIPANGTASGTFALWKNLFNTPGKYRVVAYVEYYNALPFQEFEVIAKPTVSSAPAPTKTTTSSGSQSTTSSPKQTSTSQQSTQTTTTTQNNTSSNTSSTTHQTYTIHVTASGSFDITNQTISLGDSVKFVYSAPIGDEVKISFSPATISTQVLDHDHQSRTITPTSKGTWTFRATNSGKTGILKVI